MSGAGRANGQTRRSAERARRLDPRALLLDGLHLAALSAFAFAQPLFDLLGKNPEFFAARGSQATDIVVFAVAVTVAPPGVLLLLEGLAGLAYPPLRRMLHLVFVAALIALIAVQVLKREPDLSSSVVLAGAGLLGAVVALAYRRTAGIRAFLTVLSPAAIVFLALFLLFSSVSELTLASRAEARVGRVPSDVPVVMVVFDEFPLTSLLDARGRIDSELYPSFAHLARDATWFPNATGVHDSTPQAVPAILDGKYPAKGSLPVTSDHPDSLFTLFGGEYALNVVEEATAVCPEKLCERNRGQGIFSRLESLAGDLSIVYGHLALPSGLASGLPSVSDTLGNFAGEGEAARERKGIRQGIREAKAGAGRALRSGERASGFADWVAAIRSGPRPSLHFNHVFFPHVPWQHLPSGRRYLEGTEEPLPGLARRRLAERTIRDEFVVRQAYQRHLLQVGFTDRLLGTLLDRLHEQGLYDRALIVLAADHGAIFRRGQDRRVITRASFEDLASIPLLIKAPRQRRGHVSDAYVQTTDIVPTVADLLDVRLPWLADGRSAFSKAVRERRSVEMAHGHREGQGFKVSLGAAEFERRQAVALERKVSIFGAGRKGPGLYGIGPHPELLGKPVRGLAVRRSARPRAEIARSADLRSVDLRSDFLPALVEGRIAPGGQPPKRDLAFALNGRIVAVGESFSLLDQSKEHFAAMLPEQDFRQGANRLEVFAVSSDTRRLQLLGHTR